MAVRRCAQAQWARGIVLGLAVAVAAAGCGSADDPGAAGAVPSGREAGGGWPEQGGLFGGPGAGAWWAGPPGADLVATGAELVASPGLSELAVDGRGDLWMHGGWRVLRVDPATRTAQEWDLGDDGAFADVTALHPAQGAGAWLVSPDRLRLFDGERFIREVQVPADVRGGPDGQITDLVQVGSRVWVSSPAGIFRLADGSWTRLSPDGVTAVASLTPDGAGGVWANGRTSGSAQPDTVVGGVDSAGRWLPAPGGPRRVDEVMALPGGGVLVRGGADLSAFDGMTWTRVPPLRLDVGGPLARDAAVTADGAVWVRGDRGLARLDPGGSWRLVRGSTPPPLRVIASGGESLFALTGASLVRYDRDGGVEPIWQDEAPAMLATSDGVADWRYWPEARPSAGEHLRPRHVVALSATEAWVAPQLYPRPFRREDGRWREIPVAPLAADAALALASDGVVWALTVEGLVRFPRGAPPEARPRVAGSRLIAGAGGSIWVLPDTWYGWWYLSAPNSQGQIARAPLVNVGPDGERTVVPLPAAEWTLTSVVAGGDGSVWVTHCPEGGLDPCPSGADLMRWQDGRWRSVAYPGRDMAALAVPADGALWARVRPEPGAGPVLARYHGGSWSTWSDVGDLSSVALAPGGSLCTITQRPELACVAQSGAVRREPVPVAGRVSIGLDGSIWVVGDGGVATLAPSAP